MHCPIAEQGRWLGLVFRGFSQYHAVPTNGRAVNSFRGVNWPEAGTASRDLCGGRGETRVPTAAVVHLEPRKEKKGEAISGPHAA
jgi:hypothetical protein